MSITYVRYTNKEASEKKYTFKDAEGTARKIIFDRTGNRNVTINTKGFHEVYTEGVFTLPCLNDLVHLMLSETNW